MDEKLRQDLSYLMNKVNKVTSAHYHRQKIYPTDLDELYNAQLIMEEALRATPQSVPVSMPSDPKIPEFEDSECLRSKDPSEQIKLQLQIILYHPEATYYIKECAAYALGFHTLLTTYPVTPTPETVDRTSAVLRRSISGAEEGMATSTGMDEFDRGWNTATRVHIRAMELALAELEAVSFDSIPEDVHEGYPCDCGGSITKSIDKTKWECDSCDFEESITPKEPK